MAWHLGNGNPKPTLLLALGLMPKAVTTVTVEGGSTSAIAIDQQFSYQAIHSDYALSHVECIGSNQSGLKTAKSGSYGSEPIHALGTGSKVVTKNLLSAININSSSGLTGTKVSLASVISGILVLSYSEGIRYYRRNAACVTAVITQETCLTALTLCGTSLTSIVNQQTVLTSEVRVCKESC